MGQTARQQLLMQRPHLDHLPARRPLGPGYELRMASGDSDDQALATVLTAAFGETWSVERVRSALTRAPDVPQVYVATWHGEVVATASCLVQPERIPGCGWVHWVGAEPGHAGAGLGTVLVLRLLEDFRERGFGEARLHTDDFRVPAITTYLRCGFLPVLTVEGEDHRGRWSAVMQEIFAPR
jgi:mycothiol synthase